QQRIKQSAERRDSGRARENDGSKQRRQRIAEAQETSAVLGIVEPDRIRQIRNRIAVAQMLPRKRFRLLVARDARSQNHRDQNDSAPALHECPSTRCGSYGSSSAFISSSVSRIESAATASSRCDIFVAPTIGDVTPGFASSHARAT